MGPSLLPTHNPLETTTAAKLRRDAKPPVAQGKRLAEMETLADEELHVMREDGSEEDGNPAYQYQGCSNLDIDHQPQNRKARYSPGTERNGSITQETSHSTTDVQENQTQPYGQKTKN